MHRGLLQGERSRQKRRLIGQTLWAGEFVPRLPSGLDDGGIARQEIERGVTGDGGSHGIRF
jgi:hypothetical protein